MLPVLVAAAFAFRSLDDADTWWHLASGRWIAEHQAVQTTDPFSFTVPNNIWVNLQWLYDLFLYGLYQIGGADILVVAATVAYGGAVWLLTKNLGLFLPPAGAAALGLVAVLVLEERFFIRPEMVSFFLLEAVLWLLMTARQNQGRRLWLLVPIMLVWANCHSLFILGLFAIGCWVLSALFAMTPLPPAGWRAASRLGEDTTRRLVLASAGATLATLANPYGLEGLRFPLKLVSRIDPSDPFFQAIAEFRPPFSGFVPTVAMAAYQGFFVFSVAVVTLAAGLSLRQTRRRKRQAGPLPPAVDLATLALFAGFAYLSVLARRNTAIFVLGAAPAVACCLGVIAARVPDRLRRRTAPLGRAGAPVLVALSICLLGATATNHYYRWAGIAHDFGLGVYAPNFPIRAAEFASEAHLPPRLYNDLTAGGYLAWAPPVDGGVFIDGRLEVYDRPFFASYINGLIDPGFWRKQADHYGIETVIVFHRWSSRRRLVSALLADSRWALVYYDEVAIVFVRNAGNERIVAEAQRLFPEWERRTRDSLAAPVPSWQWPAARTEAVESYARLLQMLGDGARGVEMDERLLALGVPARRAAKAHQRIAEYLAREGKTERARQELRKAAVLDPDNAAVQQMLGRLGR